MSYVEKEKLETYSDNSLQVINTNCIEDNIEENTDVCVIELSLEKRKQEASKPLYIKRI